MATDWPPMEERGPRVTEKAVAAFETKFGITLPDDYRSFLLEVNGGRTASSHAVFAVWKDHTVLNSLHSLNDPDQGSDLATRWTTVRTSLPSEIIPVGNDDGGGTIAVVIKGPRRGEVWFWDKVDRQDGNPRVEWFSRRDVTKLANSFGEFMRGLTPLDEEP